MSIDTQASVAPQRNISRFTKPIFMAAILAIWCLIPLFVGGSQYMLDLFIIMIINAVLAMGFILVFRTGLVFLAVMTFYGIGAYAGIVFTLKVGMSFWIALPLSAVTTALIAFLLSPFLLGRTTSPLQFIVISSILGMMFALAVGNTKWLGGYSGVQGIPDPPPLFGIDFSYGKIQWFYLEVVMLVVVIALLLGFYNSSVGRAWRSIGLGPRLAESIGVNIYRYRVVAFVLCTFIVGLFGCFYAHYIGYISPDGFNMWQNTYLQLYAILGGLGFPIWGPIVGAGIMVFVPEYLRPIRQYAQLFTALILILLILYMPSGILGIKDAKWVRNISRSIQNAIFRPKAVKANQTSGS